MSKQADIGLTRKTTVIHPATQSLNWRWLEEFIKDYVETELEGVALPQQALPGSSGCAKPW